MPSNKRLIDIATYDYKYKIFYYKRRSIFATKEEAIAACERLNELSMETES